jgi:hypothetical protein
MTPQNENPQPSEHDPPPGWYTGQSSSSSSNSNSNSNLNSNSVSGAQGSKPPTTNSAYDSSGGLPAGYGQSPKPLKWWAIVLLCVAGAAFLALVTWAVWRLRKKMGMKKGVGGPAPEMGEGGGGGHGGDHDDDD